MLKLKRAYEAPENVDGFRILVERMWPRGISKEKMKLDLWAKEITPSPEIRKEFCHVPEKFPELICYYQKELDENPKIGEFVQLIREKLAVGGVTLLYGSKAEEQNPAVVLREYLLKKLEEEA
jgi:Uncharacterized conserved protein